MISRKKFLQLTGLGIASSLVPNFLFAKTFELPSEELMTMLKAARRLRKQGKWSQAKTKYQEILAIYPQEIRAYNGIRKILLRKKGQELQVIQLYKNASENLPNEMRIKRRLYDEYIKAAIGNKKVASQLNVPTRILVFVKQRYEEMLSNGYPNHKNLEKRLAKLTKYIELNVDNIDARTNKALKKHKKENQRAHKQRLKQLTVAETSVALAKLKAQPAVEKRMQQIREMSKANVFSLRKSKQYEDALTASTNFLETVNKSDPYFMKQFRELAKQLKKYDQLLSFEQFNHSQKKTFWSALALLDVYLKQAEENGNFVEREVNSLITELDEKKSNPVHSFEVISRKIKVDLLKSDFESAKTRLVDVCRQKMGITDAHSIDRVNLLVAKYFVKQGLYDQKNLIIEIAQLPKKFLNHQDEMIKSIALMNLDRSREKAIHMQQLQQNINNLQG